MIVSIGAAIAGIVIVVFLLIGITFVRSIERWLIERFGK
jgi:regulator of protease activity HflC (stomatin/prohibitin superfamily)